MSTAEQHQQIALFDDPNKCADYIERHGLNEFTSLNPFVVEILGNRFAASRLADCWDREHEYFKIVHKHGKRVLEGTSLNKRHLTLVVNNN